MPAVAEPPIEVQAPPVPEDGGFMDRLSALQKGGGTPPPNVDSGASTPIPATPTPPASQDAPTVLPDGKKGTPEEVAPKAGDKVDPPAPKVGASEAFKDLAKGGLKTGESAATPTPEQKKEFTMKELRLRAEKADTLEKELADVRKEIETAKAAGATPDQLKILTEERDTLKTSITEYERRLAASDVMQSKHYQENVTQPMEAIWGELVKASDEFKFPLNELGAALQIADHRQRLSALAKVFDKSEVEMDALNKQELVNGSLEFLRREYLGRSLLTDAKKAQEAIKADESRKALEQKDLSTKTFKEQSENIFSQMFSEKSLEDMPFLAPKGEDGKPVPNRELLKQIRDAATADKEPWRLALDSYSTELLPIVMDYAKEKDARIAELEERIGKLSGSGPKGGGAITHDDTGNPDDKLTLQERLAKMQGAQGLRFGPG